MTWSGIEPQSSGPLANTLTIISISQYIYIIHSFFSLLVAKLQGENILYEWRMKNKEMSYSKNNEEASYIVSIFACFHGLRDNEAMKGPNVKISCVFLHPILWLALTSIGVVVDQKGVLIA